MTPFALACRAAWAITLAWLLADTNLRAQDETPRAKPDESAAEKSADPAGIEFFEKKVRPLLVARCHECHGPSKQKGNLRLDSRAAVLKGGDTSPAIVPGKPEESLLVDAIRYGDTFQMPPKSQLPAEDIATLIEWVRIGAPWGSEPKVVAGGNPPPAPFDLAARAGHWSFQPIAAVEPPNVGNPSWVKTPIDRFILARLEAAGLKPAPVADKRTLLRRVTFDLVGLPPTPAEIEAFLADESPTAWETVVDRLLASPHYGERWARHWLDLVRYAETWGHEFDFEMPNAFRYRDYVIRAINDDLPYDHFVVEHVAGDLLPTPRRHPQEGFNESVIATGCFFLGESKHSPVDVRQDEADRIDNQIDVFGKTFLGLTIACARCHDHKFDPISTKDYYALAGYLESSRYQQAFIDPPELLQNAIVQLKELQSERRRLCFDFAREVLQPRLRQLAQTLLVQVDASKPEERAKQFRQASLTQVDSPFHPWFVLTQQQPDGAADHFAERRAKLAAELKERLARPAAGGSVVFADFSTSGYGPWQTYGEAFGHGPGKPLEWPLVGSRGRFPGRLLGNNAAHSGQLSTRLRGTLRSPTFTIEQPKIFYRLYGTGGQVRLILDGLLLIQNPIYGGLQFAAGGEQPHWHEQDVSKWIGQRAYIEVNDDGDGYLALEKVVFSDGAAPEQKPNSLVAEVLDDPAVISPSALADRYQVLFRNVFGDWLAEPNRPHIDAADRAAIIQGILEQEFFDRQSFESQEKTFQASLAALDERQRQVEARIEPPRQAMALADGTPENEHVFIRGSHKALGDEVPRRFLEVLGGTRQAPPPDSSGRLELAQQMIADENGLLRRVIVNRLWQHHFGEGIVRSPDDFGVMGQPPTHPELLDFLAAELIGQHWSLKQMHRLMLLSNAYQMSSQPEPVADRADPQNKLLHRMPVRRLEAECIRDAILAVSGRADAKLYGPSVLPNFTEHMTGRGRPKDSGPLDGQGRRSIYLGVRRNFLSPMFLAFDYPIPFTTMGRRSVSNVPAQALTMMNNPFVVEQARLWAARVLSMPDRSDRQRVLDMYVAALGRPPEGLEEQAALSFLGQAAGSAASADPRPWADLAHVLFNVKEFIFIQ